MTVRLAGAFPQQDVGMGTFKSSRLNLDSLLRSISQGTSAAKAANLLRYDQIMAMFDDLISRAGPGGAFEKAGLAQIERAKTKGVGQEMSRLIGSGLASTTEFGATERKWEADVGAQARTELASLMEQKRTAAVLGKAGVIERRTDTGPDINLLASLLTRV